MTHTDAFNLDDRFELLRGIIQDYHERIRRMEAHVVKLFADGQLAAISETIREKQRIERRIQQLEQFVAYWEPLSAETDTEHLEAHTTVQHLNVPGNLRYI